MILSSRLLSMMAVLFVFVLSFATAFGDSAAEGPLKSLPYTPSLDLAALDQTQDPCVDFYQFACGGWEKNNPIPPDQAGWDVYNKLHNENMRYLWGLLEEAAVPSPERSPAQQKIGDFFAACMDEAAIDQAGAAPLKPVLDQIEGLTNLQALGGFLGRLKRNGDDIAPFGFGSNQDFGDATQVIAFATAGGLGLPDRDQYLMADAKSEEIRQKYLAHIQRMLVLAGDSPEKAKAAAGTIMAMETEMAKASLTRVELRDPQNIDHKMTKSQVQKLTPQFNWTAYFTELGIPGTKNLNLTEPAFMKQLDKLLETRSLEAWKTYLRWQAINGVASYLGRPFAEASFDFYGKTLRGQQALPPRWKRCVQWTDRNLGEALGQVFVQKTFSPETKKRALDMTLRIQKTMESEIKQLDWMGEKTKKRALGKLAAMVNKIGYPDKWRDYSALEIKRGDFFGNIERSWAFEDRRQLNKIGKPLDRGEWGMTPPTVNAYYDPQLNDMNFPAGVLQPPLFDPNMDDAPNYGNTGGTIGHELIHGFDDSGRQFDAKGNLKDWWTKEDAAAFEKLIQCTIDQYAQYTVVDDIKINSKLSVGEDVADLAGLQLAYLAWRGATKDQNLKPVGGFTPDQRFFIGFAQWVCNNERPENMRLRALTDPHSPGRYRINGVVVNMPEFARAFKCQAGQPMVGQKPCKIW